MFGRIYAVAINTFREAVRDKVLYGVVGLATLVVMFSLALGELSLNENERVVADIGMASISLFAVIISVFLGASLLHKEIERKTLYVILPKPIARFEFLLGKYFGIVMTALVFVGIMGGVHLWVTALQRGASWLAALGVLGATLAALGLAAKRVHDRAAIVWPWALFFIAVMAGFAANHGVALTPLLAAFALNGCEVILLTAVALVFSSFSTPFLTGAFAMGVWVLGRSTDTMEHLAESQIPDELKALLAATAKVVPNFHLFVPGRHALTTGLAESGSGTWLYVAQSGLYGCLYAAMLLTFASLIFRRRDFL